MTIIQRDQVRAAVERALQLDPNRDMHAAIASAAQALCLPVGTGRFVNAQMIRHEVDRIKEPLAHDPSKSREVVLYENGNWRDEIDLPVRAMKPTIIEAVGKALEEEIFDALGIAPAYRETDPIIAGQIRKPDGGVVTFFVAWWLDESDL